MANTNAPDPIEDKRTRYKIEVDTAQTIMAHGRTARMVAVLTKRDRPDETVRVHFYNLDLPEWRSSFDGPPWKRHHADLYAAAVLAEMTALGGVLPPLGAGADFPAAPAPPPVIAPPPWAPACPKCGARLISQCAHVGGRGTCWRHACPAAQAETCDYIERWQS